MTPEGKSRTKIDKWFNQSGWQVVNRDEFTPCVTAIAVREGLLEGNLEADYLLFLNGKAVGVLEAKREEIDVSSNEVSRQVETYAEKVPDYYPVYSNPLPLLYKSNGKALLFKDNRKENSDYEPIASIHTPKELSEMLNIDNTFAGLPFLSEKGLRVCQYEAISGLENSFRLGGKRALIVLATGAGKTFTACLAAYRMLTYTPIRRILFLVDRNNLGKQAEGEFGKFSLTESGDKFNTIYTVNRLKSPEIPEESNVVISTIQRLFSLLKGEPINDNDEEENSNDSGEVVLPDSPTLTRDFFDLIIIDECHRSIYGRWRKVLDYFNTARLIGLTATPEPDTKAFFNNNIVVNYTLGQSIADGVNVDAVIYRIKTKVTEDGGAIKEGDKVKVTTRYTGKVETITKKEDKTYTSKELNRSVINPSQIKLVLSTYRDAVYSEMFNDPQREPNMDYLPKTLIFALNEAHATNIVNIAKEVFQRKDNDFVQKITYSAGDSNELIRKFRNDKKFRIAVTCTLVATGTDIKPLEVVMFMRDVESSTLYTQMKGRGVRTIGDEQLREVTPNAISKDFYVLVDAVGVTEHDHTLSGPNEPPTEIIPLKILLERIALGNVPDDYLRRLASVLARLNKKADREQKKQFKEIAKVDMKTLSKNIYDALDKNTLPPYKNVNEPNLERKALVAPVANLPKLREYILILNAGFIERLLPGEDELIYKGFTEEEAKSETEEFEKYCNEHQDEIEALRIIYNNEGAPITYNMLKELETRLKLGLGGFSTERMWNFYTLLRKDKVRKNKENERGVLTNLIQLVRFAYKKTEKLECLLSGAKQKFELWCGQKQGRITDKQREVIAQIVEYLASNGMSYIKDLRENDETQAAQIVSAFGGVEKANEAIVSLYNFVVIKKAA